MFFAPTPYMPYKARCQKCGSPDAFRKWHAVGDSWRVPVYGETTNQCAQAVAYMASATAEHIDNTCRVCAYNWQTLPISDEGGKE